MEARKRFLYCAWGALGEREIQRERRQWRHHCRAKIGDEFTLPLAKNSHFSFLPSHFSSLPSWMVTIVELKFAMKFHFPLPKNVALFNGSDSLSSRSLFCFCHMAWQGIESPKQTIEFPAAPSFSSSKKWIKLIPKTIGNRKRDCASGCARGDKHHLRKSADRKAQIRKVFFPLTGLVYAFRSPEFLRWCLSPERNLTHNLFFLFPIALVLIKLS